MNSNWTQEKLSDCTVDENITYGVVQPGKACDDGIPMIRVNNFDDGKLIDLDTALKISKEVSQNIIVLVYRVEKFC